MVIPTSVPEICMTREPEAIDALATDAGLERMPRSTAGSWESINLRIGSMCDGLSMESARRQHATISGAGAGAEDEPTWDGRGVESGKEGVRESGGESGGERILSGFGGAAMS